MTNDQPTHPSLPVAEADRFVDCWLLLFPHHHHVECYTTVTIQLQEPPCHTANLMVLYLTVSWSSLIGMWMCCGWTFVYLLQSNWPIYLPPAGPSSIGSKHSQPTLCVFARPSENERFKKHCVCPHKRSGPSGAADSSPPLGRHNDFHLIAL